MFDELISTAPVRRGAKVLEIGLCAPAKKVSPQASKNTGLGPEDAGFGLLRVKNHASEYATGGVLELNSISAALAQPVS